jgi:Protein of unknown function (DUF3102)
MSETLAFLPPPESIASDNQNTCSFVDGSWEYRCAGQLIAIADLSLETMAIGIKGHRESAERCFGQGVEHAIGAGGLLIEAKKKIGHGEWLPWLENNCELARRTAQAYMQLARLPAEKRKAVAHLPVEKALVAIRDKERLVADPRAAELRARAAEFGYKIRRRGSEYQLDRKDGSGIGGMSDLDEVAYHFDICDGKVAVQYAKPCGTPIPGANNAAAVERYEKTTGTSVARPNNWTPHIKIRQKLESTGEIPPLDTTVGADGKTRKKPNPAEKERLERAAFWNEHGPRLWIEHHPGHTEEQFEQWGSCGSTDEEHAEWHRWHKEVWCPFQIKNGPDATQQFPGPASDRKFEDELCTALAAAEKAAKEIKKHELKGDQASFLLFTLRSHLEAIDKVANAIEKKYRAKIRQFQASVAERITP